MFVLFSVLCYLFSFTITVLYMDLITTHINADFDALSSLVAASKLYPNARLLLPGSQEKSVRNFLALIKDKIKIESEKTCRMDDVNRLIILDSRHKSRIGDAAGLLKKKVKVHIYDHHPRTRSDIKGDKDVFKKVGATVTIILEILAAKGKFRMSPLEATLMLLGIYEETGSLSYSTTTKADVDMVSRLLAQGANLSAVSSYLNRELTESELSALIGLLGSVKVVNVSGINVAFAHIDASRFDGEMGAVVHKLQDVENYPVLFAMFKFKQKVRILARSRVGLVNMNKLLGHFNGAGHLSAASARVDGRTIDSIKGEILKLLDKMIQPDVYAKDIMSSPVQTVSQEERVSDVYEKLKRLGYQGAPVLDGDGLLAGMVTLGDLKKALKHKMGHSRIKGYMSAHLITAGPETPLYRLRKMMMENDKGRIPVIKDNKLVGIVTRTDVLKKVHSALFPPKVKGRYETTNVSAQMGRSLPKKLMDLIKAIGRTGDTLGMNVFLVGGFVRDLILGVKNYDLDIVIEGDAIRFGRILASQFKGALVIHEKFGTATLVKDWPEWLGPSLHPDNKFKIDIATARRETYEQPAALPTVEFSSLKEDLYRRDFTINAMAVNINRKNFGMFIDFFGGKKDLQSGIIRILHDNSFIDDPTRIFRAVRFEQRLNFQIEKHSEYLITHAVKREMFHRTENQRIRDELILILKEMDPEKAVFRMRELHELRFIHPKLVLKRSIKKTFGKLKKCVRWYGLLKKGKRQLDVWLMNFMLMLEGLSASEVKEVAEKFVLTREERQKLCFYGKHAKKAAKMLSAKKKMPPGKVYDILKLFPHEVALCVMAQTGADTAGRRIKKFISAYSTVTTKITGEDIKREGIKTGPEYTDIFRKVLYQKLNGKLRTKKDEVRYMRQLIKKEGKGFRRG